MEMTHFRIFVLFLLFLSLTSISSSSYHVILNTFDENSFKLALSKSINFNFRTQLFSSALVVNSLSKSTSLPKHLSIHQFSSSPFLDKSIFRKIPLNDYTTLILDSISSSLKSLNPTTKPNLIVSISIDNETNFDLNSQFFAQLNSKYFQSKSPHQTGAIFLSKTRRLTSISDWHDLMLFAVNPSHPQILPFISTLQTVYHSHLIDRDCCTLLEPRPAILEAIHRYLPPSSPSSSSSIPSISKSLSVSYFDSEDLCVHRWKTHPPSSTSSSSTSTSHSGVEADSPFSLHSRFSHSINPGPSCPLPHSHHLQATNTPLPTSSSSSSTPTDIETLAMFSSRSSSSTPYLMLTSGDGGKKSHYLCADLHEGEAWKRHVLRAVPQSFAHKTIHFSEEERPHWKTLMHKGMWEGSLRFRTRLYPSTSTSSTSRQQNSTHSSSSSVPLPFCWENPLSTPLNSLQSLTPRGDPSKSTSFSSFSSSSSSSSSFPSTLLANARITHSWNHSTPYQHPPLSSPQFTSNLSSSILMVSGSNPGFKLENILHLMVGKMSYARRHGYQFLHLLDRPYKTFFDIDTFAYMNNPDFVPGYMVKVPMLLDVAHRYPDKKWIFWTDEDTWIHPGWSHLPLDFYLKDVPQEKIIVMSNYRSVFSNLFAIRNNEKGRAFLRDWYAVSISGLVQCHGFDQASLQLLILQRLHGSMTSRPFNHTCTFTEKGFTGCNAAGDYSCDFKFDKTLYNLGFKSRKDERTFNFRVSSFTKGCANDFIPEVHIVTETESRPRWQCAHCSSGDRIEASGHWDGPWGGSNDKKRLGAIDSWMFNHKAQFLFFEMYLTPNACPYDPYILPSCREGSRKGLWRNEIFSKKYNSISSQDQHTHTNSSLSPPESINMNPHHHHVISLIDGMGYDLEGETFCRISSPSLLRHQLTNTYMKEYSELIQDANYMNETEWKLAYQTYGGGEAREPCEIPGSPKALELCHEDNNLIDESKRIYQENQRDFYDVENYCSEECHPIPFLEFKNDKHLSPSSPSPSSPSPSLKNSSQISSDINIKERMAMDCRLPQDVQDESTW